MGVAELRHLLSRWYIDIGSEYQTCWCWRNCHFVSHLVQFSMNHIRLQIHHAIMHWKFLSPFHLFVFVQGHFFWHKIGWVSSPPSYRLQRLIGYDDLMVSAFPPSCWISKDVMRCFNPFSPMRSLRPLEKGWGSLKQMEVPWLPWIRWGGLPGAWTKEKTRKNTVCSWIFVEDTERLDQFPSFIQFSSILMNLKLQTFKSPWRNQGWFRANLRMSPVLLRDHHSSVDLDRPAGPLGGVEGSYLGRATPCAYHHSGGWMLNKFLEDL